MKLRLIAYWALFAITMALYVTIVVWSLPQIAEDAGAMPFDLRPTGYDFDAAIGFLGALSAEGRDFYLGTQHVLDTAFPLALSGWLAWSLVWALVKAPQIWRTLSVVAAFGIMMFDNLENRAVAGLLQMDVGDITPELVATASQWTVLKSGTSTVCFIVLLGGLIWRFVTRNRA